MSTPYEHSQDVALLLRSNDGVFGSYLSKLDSAAIPYRVCDSLEDFCIQLVNPDVFCAVVYGEALINGGGYLLGQVMQMQMKWNDVPLVVIDADHVAATREQLPEALSLTAPVSDVTLLSILQLARRHRSLQLQAREQAAPVSKSARAIGPLSENPDPATAGLVRPIQVLLVDDHEIVLKGLRGVMAFYKDVEIVGEARSGIEAMTKAEELQPQVIIMDVNMPMGNGIEVTRAIKSAFPGITIIGLSVYNDSAVVDSMREAGADAFLEKGIDENVIHAAIQAHSQRVGRSIDN